MEYILSFNIEKWKRRHCKQNRRKQKQKARKDSISRVFTTIDTFKEAINPQTSPGASLHVRSLPGKQRPAPAKALRDIGCQLS